VEGQPPDVIAGVCPVPAGICGPRCAYIELSTFGSNVTKLERHVPMILGRGRCLMSPMRTLEDVTDPSCGRLSAACLCHESVNVKLALLGSAVGVGAQMGGLPQPLTTAFQGWVMAGRRSRPLERSPRQKLYGPQQVCTVL
jgi:hypothetical protein